jgi:transcriptional regulator with XRE-family HTH domain
VKDLLVSFGKRMRALRSEKGWSQEEFAYQCGLHRTYIGHVELGKKNISFNNLAAVSAALGITMSELFAGLEDGT